MACPTEAELQALLEGRLAGSEAAAARAHLDTCHECAAVAAAYVADAPSPDVTIPPRPIGDLLQRGDAVGRFMILDLLGTGSMGVVYTAFDPQLNRRVALKFLRQASTARGLQDEANLRMLREAQAMARLSHPNVVSVYEVQQLDGQLAIAMELLEGQTLREWSGAGERSWRQTLAVFVDAGRGLAAAHDAGLVHRDFKPENVLINEHGRVCVTDFGLARDSTREVSSLESDFDSEPGGSAPALAYCRTATGAVLGTPAYMAPEQRAGGPASPASDQFSFCVALHEALYGVRPTTARRVATGMLDEQASRACGAHAGGRPPKWVRQIIQRGLATEPHERFASMSELLAAVEGYPRRRTRVRVVVAVGLVLAGGSWFGSKALDNRAALCTGGVRQWQEIWTAERISELERLFLASKRLSAAKEWSTVRGAIGAYGDAWVASHRDLCEATHVRGEQSEDLLDRGMVCLDLRLRELSALIDIFRAGDADVLGRASAAVARLGRIDACTNLQATSSGPRRPANMSPEQFDELKDALAQFQAQVTGGLYSRAQAGVGDLLRLIEPVAEDAWHAEVHFAVSTLYMNLEQGADCEKHLYEALERATAAGLDTMMARIYARLSWATGNLEGRLQEGRRWNRLAEAAIARVGGDDVIEAERLCDLAQLEYLDGRLSDAARLEERCLQLRRQVLGDINYPVALGLINLAGTYCGLGEYGSALSRYELAEKTLAETVGERHPVFAVAVDGQGAALTGMGKPDAALKRHERALALRQAILPASHPHIADSLANVAQALIKLGRYDEAVRHSARAAAMYEEHLGPKDRYIADTLGILAQAQLGRGDCSASLATLDRCLTLREELFGGGDPAAAEPMLTQASAYLCLRRSAEAERAARRAQEIPEISVDLRARAAFLLARALWEGGGDRVEAISSARKARTLYGKQPNGDGVAAVDAWLSSKASPATP